jgi:hypothetical protein
LIFQPLRHWVFHPHEIFSHYAIFAATDTPASQLMPYADVISLRHADITPPFISPLRHY